MYLCQHGFQILVHPLCIVTWKHGCQCVTYCVCSSQSTSVPTPCLECVHGSVHVFVLIWLPMSAKPPLDRYMETWVPICVNVCVCVPVTLLMIPYHDLNVYMHQDMYTCPPDLQCLFHPLWIVIWKPGCPCMGLWLHLNDPTSVPIPWLEDAHASVYVYMSTWLPMSAPPTNQRWELQLEVRPLMWAPTSDWRSHLQLEVSPPIGALTLVEAPTSNQRSHLLEVFFIPSGVITILDYMKNKQVLVSVPKLIIVREGIPNDIIGVSLWHHWWGKPCNNQAKVLIQDHTCIQKCQQSVLAQLIHAWAASANNCTFKPKAKDLEGLPLLGGQFGY